MKPIKVSVQEMYGDSEENYNTFLAELDQSLNPRSPDMLYDKFKVLEPGPESIVLDIGCRNAAQACEIAQRFGCRVIGIDLVDANIQEAKKRIAEKGLKQSVQVIQGDIHHLPFAEKRFDFIWCRDVLPHMDDLNQVFKSCIRVLKPNGKMLIFQMFTTNLFTSNDAEHFFQPLASKPENMSKPFFEKVFTAAGFSIIESDILSSEWREYGEETEAKITSKQLLRIARMRRNREKLVAKFGEKNYASELANCHWGVYQMLGKLSPTVYSLIK